MTNARAIEVIKNNWPDGGYSMLREALTLAIKALEKVESMQNAIEALAELEAVE